MHGVIHGQALKGLQAPAGSKRTVLLWLKRAESYARIQKDNDNFLQIKKASYRDRDFYFDLHTGGRYMSLAEENAITEEDLPRLWKEVEIADEKEMGQFVDEHAFEKRALRSS